MSAPATAIGNKLTESHMQPRVWTVLGDKKGDNGQVHTIVEALGWHCEQINLQMLEPFVFGKPKVGATLYHIDSERSDALEPPWPELIITVGRRPANAALWVREQSGGATKIVLLGKPSGMMRHFDLIISSSENLFPPLENVLNISLPLMRVDTTSVEQQAVAWESRLNSLPKPLIGIMIGGPTGPFVFNKTVSQQVINIVKDVLEASGTPYITTSRRTPIDLIHTLKEQLPTDTHLFQWQAQAKDNPYLALLGLADGFVVTGDSISMMVEIARLRKPLSIMSLPTGFFGGPDQARRSLARWLFAPVGSSIPDKFRGLIAQMVYKSGFIKHTRDFRAFHQKLFELGLAVPTSLQQKYSAPSGSVPDDVAIAVKRIKKLMGYN